MWGLGIRLPPVTSDTPEGPVRWAHVTSASLFSPRLISALSAWNEHVPFAGWLIEATRPRLLVELGTHAGVSYFAFCEAVQRLGLGTECYAVDTWLGDEHAGFYGEEIYRSVVEINDQYESFSRLFRTSFDDAVEEFSDGSIDVLHIDGLHTYEAVRHDFETWLPKLSDRGLVALHDTNERKPDFGVYRFFGELAETYPTFEFTHGHGLGVIAVGSDVPERLLQLVHLDRASEETRMVREHYKALGGRFTALNDIDELEGETHRLSAAVDAHTRELAEIKKVRASELERLDTRNRELAEIKKVRASDLKRQRQLSRELASVSEAVRTRNDEVSKLNMTISTLSKRASEAEASLSLSRQRVADLETSTSWRITAPLRFVAELIKKIGRRVRDRAGPGNQPERTESIHRLYEAFDMGSEQKTRRQLKEYIARNPELRQRLVSVVMPTLNRASVLPTAIESVLNQDHHHWELIIVDDGSTDDTEHVVSEFTADSRIKYVKSDQAGVGAARNRALDLAAGDIIAYLDSDNWWDPEFLSLMIAGMDDAEVEVGYSAVELVRDGRTVGFRGDVFDYEACLEANYIDINALCHTRAPIDAGLHFEPKIRRTNDWDLILGLTHGRAVAYVPVLGVHYTLESRDDQISTREPFVFRHIVQERHRRRSANEDAPLETFDVVVRQMSLSFAIRIAAPFDKREQWGDHHFAASLRQSFERQGHSARVYYVGEEIRPREHDVVMVIRGLERYEPVSEAVNVLWSISHPDLVGFEELDEFDLVFVASESYQRVLRHLMHHPVSTLRQATDRARFYPHTGVDRKRELLFVGNSRNVIRPTVRMAVDTGLPLTIYGSGWEGIVPDEVVRSPYLPNEAATHAYAEAGVVLNDHWESMKDFGYISNRIYDALASGATVLSDSFPELEREFGDVVSTFESQSEFLTEAEDALDRTVDDGRRVKPAMEILERHTFDARTARLVDAVHGFLGVEVEAPPDAQARPSLGARIARTSHPPRIGIIPQMPNGRQWTSSAYIRLLQPLTSDLPGLLPELKTVAPDRLDSIDELGDLDCVIVSRTAVETPEHAKLLLSHLRETGARLVVDTDDAFHLMDASHPEYETYREHVEALDILLGSADEIWCSTDPLKEAIDDRFTPRPVVIPNSIDPRLWKRYRYRDRSPRVDDALELVYFGTATHGRDLAIVIPVLDDLAASRPGSFRLSIIGIAPDLPDRSWISRINVPQPSTYPHFARWMRDIAGKFDVGLAPLRDTPFNGLKSDIKVLEYSAMGLPAVVSSVGPYQDLESVDRCESVQDWFDALGLLISDRAELDDRRIRVQEMETEIWLHRKAAKTGEALLGRIGSLLRT